MGARTGEPFLGHGIRFSNVRDNVTNFWDSIRIPDTPLRFSHGTSRSGSFAGLGDNRSSLNNRSFNERQLVSCFQSRNIYGAKVGELIFVAVDVK